VLLKCGGKWLLTLEVEWEETQGLSEWCSLEDAQESALSALNAVIPEDEAHDVDHAKMQSVILDALEGEYGWECEQPCTLRITLLGFELDLTITPGTEPILDPDSGQTTHKALLRRKYKVTVVFLAECIR
jgi:hypothetical protein